MPQIYITYDPTDSAFVESLAPSLEKNYDHVILGAALDAATARQHIASSDLVLSVESPAALQSPRVQADLNAAAQLGKPVQTAIVRPTGQPTDRRQAEAAPAAEPQPELAENPPVDLSSGLDNNRQLFALYSAINQTLQPPPPVPPPSPPTQPAPVTPAPSRMEAFEPVSPTRSRVPVWIIISVILVFLLLIGAAIVLLSGAEFVDVPGVRPTATADVGIAPTETPLTPEAEADQMTTVILPLAIAIVGFAIVGITLLFSIRQRFREIQAQPPLVFISYRRDPSWGQARCIADSLRERGIRVFMDVDNIDEGKFAEIIQQAIHNCDHFVPIIAPTTLESEWVRREIVLALEYDRSIIPLLVDGFQFSIMPLPDEVKEIASHNAITVTHEFYDAAMERLATRFIKNNAEIRAG